MTENSSNLWKLKPVFPVLYLVVFLHAVLAMFLGFVSSPPDEMVSAVNGKTNKNFMLYTMYFFAGVLCLYDVVYYARLEILEHHQVSDSIVSSWVYFIEFIIRLLLISLVALKVFKYEFLEDVFLFSAIMCLLLCVWYFYLKYHRILDVSYKDIFPNIIVLILSVVAVYFSSSPVTLQENAIPVLIISILAAIFLTASVGYLLYRFGEEFLGLAKNFVINWNAQR